LLQIASKLIFLAIFALT